MLCRKIKRLPPARAYFLYCTLRQPTVVTTYHIQINNSTPTALALQMSKQPQPIILPIHISNIKSNNSFEYILNSKATADLFQLHKTHTTKKLVGGGGS
jgi:hypothetical protein